MTAHAVKPCEGDISIAATLLEEEAKALTTLAQSLDETFVRAVDVLAAATGKVIVTGMGKSGHIGAKIAATMASTGTPAFFVHPGEASHGDLGMITPNDVVIAISHSGESKELGDMLAYCTRFNVPLVALTGRERSTLGQAATVTLLNKVEKEACPINKAPTTSTTATLALGDALAVALMQRQGFLAEDFARFHPGGKLGAQMKTAAELMATGDQLPTVLPEVRMKDVVLEMTSKNLGGVAVVQGGQLKGMITDGDLKRHISQDWLTQKAQDVMNPTPIVITPQTLASTALALMQEKRITSLLVAEEKTLKGLLHIHHLLQAGVV